MIDVTAGKSLRRLPVDLEQGIYLQAEATLLAGLPKSTIRRWLQLVREVADMEAVSDQPLVSFLDLISLRTVAALRKLGLRPSRIREGAEGMRRDFDIGYPLALENLKTDGVHLYFIHETGLVAVGAGGQMAAQELVSAYLQDVAYTPLAPDRRLATAWEPAGVSIDPRFQRGAPCVAGSRVQIALLQRYVDAGDSPERLADLFELDPVDVGHALRWQQGLRHAA